jgi:Zn-dependent protease with chaperone function
MQPPRSSRPSSAGPGGLKAPPDPRFSPAPAPTPAPVALRGAKPKIASGVGDAEYGRIALAFVAALILVPLIVALVAFYLAEYGRLPFTYTSGPLGITPWEPLLVLGVMLLLVITLPRVIGRLRPTADTFYAQAAKNRRNSLFLSAAIILALALVTYVAGVVVTLRTSVALGAAAFAMIAGLASGVLAFAMGDRVLLRLSSARPLPAGASPQLDDVVAEIALAAGIPAPARYVIEEPAPNAFVAGLDPAHAVLVVTRGLLDTMDREELQAVIAHELGHIRNYDSRYNLVVAIGVGAVVLVTDGFFRVVTWPFRLPGMIADAGRSGTTPGGGSGGGWTFGGFGGGGGSSGGGGVAGVATVAAAMTGSASSSRSSSSCWSCSSSLPSSTRSRPSSRA